MLRKGDAVAGNTLTQARLREVVIYDPEDGAFTWAKSRSGCAAGRSAGSIASNGYWRIKIDRREYGAHRLACLYMTGSMPETVDHINGIRTDNRWSNLRPATQKQQTANRRARASSGVKGVSWQKHASKWRSSIMVEGKSVHLGYFASKDEAGAAYFAAAREHFGEFATVRGG